MSKRFIATMLAASIALTTISAAPARADDKFGKFLLGAGALLIIGSVMNNRNNNRNDDRGRIVTRRDSDVHVHVQPRSKVLPGVCLRYNQWDNGPRRFFGKRCLRNNMHNISRLPNQCRRSVWTNHGKRNVFAARCLRKNGWVIG